MKLSPKALAILAGAGILLGLARRGPAQELNLGELLQEALAQNPELKAREAEVSAAAARVPQAGALPDPMLTLGVMSLPVDSWSFNREPMTQKTVELSQEFPFPGKRPLLARAAGAERETAEARLAALRNQVVREVREAYAELYYLDHALEINRQNLELLKQFVQVAGSRYAVGQGLQQDVLKAQVEQSMLLDRELMLTADRQVAAARLSRLLGRPADPPLGPALQLPAEPLPSDPQALADQAAANNPEILMNEKMAAASEDLEKLARRSYYPDFTVMLGYGQRDPVTMNGVKQESPDLVSGTVGFNLPIYSHRKQSQAVVENQARAEQRRHERDDAALRVREAVAAAYAQARRAEQQIELYRSGIIPQSENSLHSALAGYQVNKVDFLTLLDNQKTLYDLQTKLLRLQVDYSQALARLDELSARPVEEIAGPAKETNP
jgi:outer membrane protein, heavy metal efflux system